MVNSEGTKNKGFQESPSGFRKNPLEFQKKTDYDINDFKKLMQLLCGPDGCPWDREQTHESIKRNLLEEAYETAEAIDNNDTQGLIEELGDVLMQVIFHSNIAEKAGTFDLDVISDTACKKLIRRHPHVFGEICAKDGNESIAFWEDIKRKEKLHESTFEAMQSVARNLPELWRAEKIQKKAAKAGFDWPTYEGAFEALKSEIAELEEAIKADNDFTDKPSEIQAEIGDLLFSIVNVARFFDIDPENALKATNEKFISRFTKMELEIKAQGKEFKNMTLDEMETVYQQVKLEK